MAAQAGKDRARASRLRAKAKDGKDLTEDEYSFLENYNKSVGGVAESDNDAIDSSNDTPETPIEVKSIDSSSEPIPSVPYDGTGVTFEDKEVKFSDPDKPKPPPVKRIAMIPVGQSTSVPLVDCKIVGCPCKRKGTGEYCPVLKRKVYPNFGREQSDMYARGLIGLIKFFVELMPNMTGVEASEDELRTVSMAIRSLQEHWDQLAALSGFINPIFGLVALSGYLTRTIKTNRAPAPKQLPAKTVVAA